MRSETSLNFEITMFLFTRLTAELIFSFLIQQRKGFVLFKPPMIPEKYMF